MGGGGREGRQGGREEGRRRGSGRSHTSLSPRPPDCTAALADLKLDIFCQPVAKKRQNTSTVHMFCV